MLTHDHQRPKKIKRLRPRQPPPIRAVLIQELHDLAQELGRSPKAKEIRGAFREGKTHSEPTYYRVFGGFVNALQAARLPLNYEQPFAREELIEQLQNLSMALGRTPSEADVRGTSQAGACARPNTFKRVFGTFYTALVEAELAAPVTRENLIARLQELAQRLGRLPSHGDINRAHREGQCANTSMYIRHFGSVRKARIAAGLGGNQSTKLNEGEILPSLKELAAKLGRSPTLKEVKAACRRGECYSINTYKRRFGTYHNALKAAGVEITTRPAKADRQQLIKQLQALTKKLGRIPTTEDLQEASTRREASTHKTYVAHFGGMEAAREEAGLDKLFGKRPAVKEPATGKVVRPRRYSREQLIEDLRGLTRKLGRMPIKLDINRASRAQECAGANTYGERFGGLKAAREEAHLEEILGRLKAEAQDDQSGKKVRRIRIRQ